MELKIDTFIDLTGWDSSDSTKIILETNEFPQHIIEKDKSMRIKILAGSTGEYFEKIYAGAIDISRYDNLRFFLSKYERDLETEPERDFFKLKFSIGTTTAGTYTPAEEWYVPLLSRNNLESVNVEVTSINSFNTIRFTVISDLKETWWLDHIIACNDEFVIDSLLALKDKLNGGIEIPLGNPSSALVKDQEELELPTWANVNKYSLLKIKEGANEEFHIVAGEVSNGKIKFSNENMFDGNKLLRAYTTSAVIYLVVPALIAGRDTPFVVPGIYISGMVPVLPPEAGVTRVYDSYKVAVNQRRKIRDRRDLLLPVQVDVQSVQAEFMITINNFVQKLLSEFGRLLVNGSYYDLEYADTPSYDAGDLEGVIPVTTHFYGIKIIDFLNADISYVNIPPTYNVTFEIN